MCILCYQLVGEQDWTDEPIAHDAQRAGRHRRREVVGAVLAQYGLEYRDDGTGASAVISNRKGGTKVVGGLQAVWPAAVELVGRPLDPLDPVLLERLGLAHDSG